MDIDEYEHSMDEMVAAVLGDVTVGRAQRILGEMHDADNAMDHALGRMSREARAAVLPRVKQTRLGFTMAHARIRYLRGPEGADARTDARTRRLAREQLRDPDPTVRASAREALEWFRTVTT